MISKLIKSGVKSLLGTKRIDNVSNEANISTKVSPYYNMGNDSEESTTRMNPYNYAIPPHLNPYINPDADWETYRQLISNQEFLSSQVNQINYEHQRANQYAQLTDMIRNNRTEQQSQALHNGADSGYYERLNQAYLQGITSMQQHKK